MHLSWCPPPPPTPTPPPLQVCREVRTQSGSAGQLAALEDKLSVLEGAVVGAGK